MPVAQSTVGTAIPGQMIQGCTRWLSKSESKPEGSILPCSELYFLPGWLPSVVETKSIFLNKKYKVQSEIPFPPQVVLATVFICGGRKADCTSGFSVGMMHACGLLKGDATDGVGVSLTLVSWVTLPYKNISGSKDVSILMHNKDSIKSRIWLKQNASYVRQGQKSPLPLAHMAERGILKNLPLCNPN